MAATTPSTSLVAVQPAFTDAERFALAGCRTRSLPLFSVRRADIETFARELEARGRARATVTRRLCIARFDKYAVEEELLRGITLGSASAYRLTIRSRR